MSQNALSTYVYPSQRNITSYIGQSTTLPCWTNSYSPQSALSAVEWTRRHQSQYVYLKRDGHEDRHNQHSSFKNRVTLKNNDMKDGDLSLVVEDTEPTDRGIYECRYKESTTRSRRAVLSGDPLSIVHLKVEPEQHITAHPGEDIILPCKAPRDATVGAVEWVRTDLESEGYVFLVRDGIPDTTYQHLRYRDRVELKEGDMKDGNLSLILKAVRSSDEGKFVCRLNESGERGKRSTIQSEPVSIIHLQVTDPVQRITVRAGSNVTLPCRAPKGSKVSALEWTRPDLEPDVYIYLMKDGRPDLTRQHPSYKNRVELRNQHLKRGDLSLVLKNVSSGDVGMYECRLMKSGRRKKRAFIETLPVSIIQLIVSDAGPSYDDEEEEDEDRKEIENIPRAEVLRGRPGLYASLAGAAVAVSGILFMIYGV